MRTLMRFLIGLLVSLSIGFGSIAHAAEAPGVAGGQICVPKRQGIRRAIPPMMPTKWASTIMAAVTVIIRSVPSGLIIRRRASRLPD